ncbi:sigma-70 family RNA polymerase sigma factor [Kribbella sp. NPDC051952]|uniref:sigma-70 family RNA polymerase sigma factor n=1 Tax=Kribbella sp. NPDC051952 TaxID=3154851 RepID=UPI0034339B40
MNAGVSTQTWNDRDNLDEAVATFLGIRPRLMAIAYRYLASTSEAEDIVQETWLRWQKTDRTVVVNPPALLATMTTRLAINASQSARRRHETSMTVSASQYVDEDDDPATKAETHEAVEHALLVILESLTPKERAAFVLREAFDYSYGQISELLQLGAANTRQLVCRARRGLAGDRHVSVSRTSYQRFLHAFLDASRAGDLTELEDLLAAELAARTVRSGRVAVR